MDMGINDTRPLVPADSGPGLRPFGWTDLCARLAAAQDTRRVLALSASAAGEGGAQPDEAAGAFHRSAAALLLHAGTNAEAAVNPNPSANGKHEPGNVGTSGGQSSAVSPDVSPSRDLP